MKKLLAILLASFLMMSATVTGETMSEPTETSHHDHLTVGVVTALYGDFFTDMWGSNASDLDVRTLLHGYCLTRWDINSTNYVTDPSVVTGISVTQDAAGNRTYTMVIADDLYYSDGSHITAYDYAFSMLLSASPEMAAIGANTSKSDYILGVDAYKNGEAQFLSGVRVINETTVALTVKADYVPYFYELSYLSFVPYPISVIAPGCEVADDGSGAYIRNTDSEIKERLFTPEMLELTVLDEMSGYKSHPSIVSGPYLMTAYNAETHTATFERNAYFKGNFEGKLPSIKKISIVPVTNENMIEQLTDGTVDLINKVVSADSISAGLTAANEPEFSVINYPRSGLAFISFNCERPVIASEAVRKAIYMCLDKSALVEEGVRSYGISVDGYYGISQWVYQLVSGTLAAPVDVPGEDASEREITAYETECAAWAKLNMDEVRVYSFDVEAAAAILDEDGWILNDSGEPYDHEKDALRCRLNDSGELETLSLKLAIADTSTLADSLESNFAAHLAEAGIQLAIEKVSAEELLSMYYNTIERDCDMLLLGSNFSVAFDPAADYAFTEDEDGNTIAAATNYSMIADNELYQLAQELCFTQPEDTLAYCRNWIRFQERWAEVLPAIPLYSNVYFDFFSAELHGYSLNEVLSWPMALYDAYLSDAVTEAEPATNE